MPQPPVPIPLDDITREDFAAYEKVRRKGRWNMFDARARKASGLDESTYFAVIQNYTELMEKYPDVVDR